MERPSNDGYWNWADFSHREIVEGRARGNRRSLWLRARIQTFLFKLGHFAQIRSASVVMIGLVFLVVGALGLYKAKLETNVETLWMEVGGRLEKELAYSKEYGSDYISYEVIIQTPNVQGTNILTVPALQKHVEVVKKAMEVEVEVFSQTWTIQDLCIKPSLPGFGNFIDKKLEQLIPCTVVSPLECFWDGAKIYTENVTIWPGLKPIQWTSFNPSEFLNLLSEKLDNPQIFDKDKMDSMFREGGISYGYLNKPCLDPRENGCPSSAPNKGSRKKPDIGLELTGGCKGFAEKLMIWPEDLIVGGVQRNKSGVIKSAEALQTIINLQSDENLYNYWRETDGYVRAKIQHIEDWNVEKARTVLHAWQRKFVKVVNDLSKKSSKQNVMAFSTTSFNDLLKSFSEPNKGLIAGGYVLMLVYACFTMIRWNSMVQSQGCMGVVGVLLVSLSVAAGLGVSSFFGISFNAASTQVLPFLALGLGVDDMFLLAHTFRDLNSRNLQSKEQAGYCLSITGVSIMLTSFTNATAFFMAAIIPIPALRALCLMAGIIIIFNFLAIVIIYPAMIAMDVRRRESQRYDIFCCVQKDSHTRITQIRPDTTSYDNSMVTINNTSDEDSSLHQISTASANVSIGQSSTDAFTLPGGVALIASANCNFNSESICNGMFGGDIMALPGMGNIVISVSSAGNTGDETSQNANANVSANISNNAKGSTLDIGASSSTSSTRHGVSSKVNRGCTTAGASENLHSKKENNMMGSSQSWCDDIEDNERNKNNTSSKRGHAKSSVRFSQNLNTDTRNNPSKNNGSKFGNLHVSANAVADTTNGERSCSSNAEVILRPDQASSSREQRNSSWQNNFSNDMFKTFARFSLGHLTKTYYAPLLQKKPVKILVLFLFAVLLSVTIFGCFQVKDGIDITDVVPKGTKTSDFLEARNNYFSFYDIVIVTKSDFNYANGQDKLYRLHKAFAKVDAIVKSEDGELPKFWLIYLREWLQGLQQAFDADWERGTITLEGPYSNASSDGKLAYKLLLHTGNDGQVEQVRREKLVEKKIIHRRGFYNFLRAWRNMDPLSYEISQVQVKPDIDFWGSDKDRRIIFPAKQIKYARMPFYLNNLKDTADYVKTIKQVREICDRLNDEGLPNYPRGVPFTFWEQYIWLRKQLLVTIIIVLVASFLVISAVLVNVWAGSIVVVVLAMTSVELFGFLGLVGIKLSAIPAVTMIFSIGVGVEFSVHLCMVFVTSIGDRNQRLQQALETVLSPVVDGAISTMLGIIMLAGSEFDFVVKYFFHVLAALIVIGFLNGVVFLPVVLSLVGPNPEVVPLRDFSTSASTRSWLGLMPLNRHRCSSVSNLTVEQQQPGAQESSTETDDVHLQIMPTIEDYPSDSKTRKWKKGSFPRHFYGQNLPSTTENSKQVFYNPNECSQTGSVVRNTSSIAKLTATATVTVELQQNDHPAPQKSNAIVTRSSVPESDLTLVDVEEFV